MSPRRGLGALLLLSALTSALAGPLCSILDASFLRGWSSPWLRRLNGVRSFLGCDEGSARKSRPHASAGPSHEVHCLLAGKPNASDAAGANASQVVGVPGPFAGRYAPSANGTFRCLDGLLELPYEAVNDNFCDCADGSDEPGTPGCAGQAGACFFCPNRNSRPKFVYASRVGDGICDCCDGADEEAANPRRCPNTCEQEGAAQRSDREVRVAEVREGLRLQEESRARAAQEVGGWRGDKAKAEGRVKELEEIQKAAKEKRDELQKKVDAERAARAAEDAKKAAAAHEATLPFREDFEAPDAMERWRVAEGGRAKIVDAGKKGKALSMAGCTWGGDVFSLQGFRCSPKEPCRISYWARGQPWQGFSAGTKRTTEEKVDAHSWLAVPEEHQDGFADRAVTTSRSDDWKYYEYEFPPSDEFQMLGSPEVLYSSSLVHIMVQAHSSTGLCFATMFDDFSVERITPRASASEEKKEEVVSEYAKWALDAEKKEEKKEEVISEYAKWALDTEKKEEKKEEAPEQAAPERSAAELELEQARDAFNGADQELRAAKRSQDSLESKADYDLGENHRWFPLVDKCVEKRDQEYTYKVCFFESAKQDHTSLGDFEGWETGSDKSRVMLFTGGSRCYDGPERSMRVVLTCGSTSELLSVAEPSRCAYEAVASDISACGPEDLEEALGGERAVMPHEEL